MCPFKTGYTWCMCIVTCPYRPCVLSKQVILGVCLWWHHWPCIPHCPYRPCYREVLTNHQKVWKTAISYISVVQRKSFNFKLCIGSQIFFMILHMFFVALAPPEPGVLVNLCPVWFEQKIENCPYSPKNGYVCVCVCVCVCVRACPCWELDLRSLSMGLKHCVEMKWSVVTLLSNNRERYA